MRTAQGKPTIYLGFRENNASHNKMEVEEAQAEIRCQKRLSVTYTWEVHHITSIFRY